MLPKNELSVQEAFRVICEDSGDRLFGCEDLLREELNVAVDSMDVTLEDPLHYDPTLYNAEVVNATFEAFGESLEESNGLCFPSKRLLFVHYKDDLNACAYMTIMHELGHIAARDMEVHIPEANVEVYMDRKLFTKDKELWECNAALVLYNEEKAWEIAMQSMPSDFVASRDFKIALLLGMGSYLSTIPKKYWGRVSMLTMAIVSLYPNTVQDVFDVQLAEEGLLRLKLGSNQFYLNRDEEPCGEEKEKIEQVALAMLGIHAFASAEEVFTGESLDEFSPWDYCINRGIFPVGFKLNEKEQDNV